jgi:sarcosine oxidase subunit alpha
MFKRLHNDPATSSVTIWIDNEPHSAPPTDTVAATMLAAGVIRCRTTAVSGVSRAPYCMMGVCFDCLVSIDGVGNRQACLTRVQEGMKIETQHGKRELGR